MVLHVSLLSFSLSLSLYSFPFVNIYTRRNLWYTVSEPGRMKRTRSRCANVFLMHRERSWLLRSLLDGKSRKGAEGKEAKRKQGRAEEEKREGGALRGFIPFHLPVFEHFLREVWPENRATKITKPSERERKLGSRVRADL